MWERQSPSGRFYSCKPDTNGREPWERDPQPPTCGSHNWPAPKNLSLVGPTPPPPQVVPTLEGQGRSMPHGHGGEGDGASSVASQSFIFIFIFILFSSRLLNPTPKRGSLTASPRGRHSLAESSIMGFGHVYINSTHNHSFMRVSLLILFPNWQIKISVFISAINFY